MKSTYPRYRLPQRAMAAILFSLLSKQKRNFGEDARKLIAGVHPAPIVVGNLPTAPPQGLILLVNHYNRAGFQAWWIALTIASALSFNLHWVITSGWVYDDPLRSCTITPVSRWLLRRIAFTYDFTTMPAMPPRKDETGERAQAVRAIIHYARTTEQPLIGLAPEGYDSMTGQLQRPPSGAGRLLAHLSKGGLQWLPVGVYEQEGSLRLNFGPLTDPPSFDHLRHDLDRIVSDLAMRAIAACVPEQLRGPYSIT